MVEKNIQDIYPLSPMQQGMLFHSLLEPNSGAYIIQVSYELYGLNIAAFTRAWQTLVDRHSVLRTAFVWDKLQQPLQVVGKTVKITLTEHNWQHLSSLEQQEQLAAFLREQKTTDFNLHQAPLMRLDLIEMEAQQYQFIWTYHHLLLDGWSVALLTQELLQYYQSFCQGTNIALTPATSYKNYIAWLKQQDRDKASSFWREQLKNFNAPTVLNIADYRADGDRQKDYLEQSLQLSAEISDKLEFLARKYQLTLNTLIQGAWAILLHRYSDETDIVFGATVSGRPTTLTDSQSIVGLLINTLPVRVKINSQQLLIDWLKQLQTEQAARQEYEFTNLIDIHRVSDVPKDLPLFQSIVVFENYPVDSSLKQSIDVVDIRNFKISEQTNYPLTLYAAVDNQISLKLLYHAGRFEAKLIGNMLEHLKTLLQEIASNPEQKIVKLNILSPRAQQELINRQTATNRAYPQDRCFHKLFEAQAAKTPNAIAAQIEAEQITYQELNHRADIIAQELQTLGVKPETRVGICCDRSIEMLVGLLGIQKAGGAYIPLDPNYPKARLDYIVEDSQIGIILTQSPYESNFVDKNLTIVEVRRQGAGGRRQEAEGRRQKVEVRRQGAGGRGQEAEGRRQESLRGRLKLRKQVPQTRPCPRVPHLPIPPSPENLAYIIYTSGSTGKPKGVQITHRCLVNFLDSMAETLEISAEDTLLGVTTISFDIAALELYLPLLVGAKVVIAPASVASNGEELAVSIEKHNVTIMQATPITWKMLIASNWKGTGQLKILSGGEALEPQLAQQLISRGKEVWNLYGPTETTIWSSIYQLKPERINNFKTIPIGVAIANTQLYVLDSQLRLVPPGVAGDLYIGGAGLARGYWNRPQLTAEKFIPNPFGEGVTESEGRRQEAEGRGQEAAGSRQQAEGRRQEAEGRGQEAEGRGQEAAGSRQEAEGRRQKAGGRRQKAGGRRQESPRGRLKLRKQVPQTRPCPRVPHLLIPPSPHTPISLSSSAPSAPSAPSARLYKTGDRVRYNLNGDLEYLGRIDRQVKIRGFRIELGEIEAVLNQHWAIETAVVESLPRQTDAVTIEKNLVAYFIPKPTAKAVLDVENNSAKLRSFLQAKLPHYMIPTNYVILEEFPLTPNGKIDRGALPPIDIRPSLNIADQKPRTEIERAIAEIWQQVLQVDRVGLADNFFDLGGNSLLIIRVHSQLKETLAIDIPLVDLFKYPTIESLAEYCSQISTKKDQLLLQDQTIETTIQIEAGKSRLKQRLQKRSSFRSGGR